MFFEIDKMNTKQPNSQAVSPPIHLVSVIESVERKRHDSKRTTKTTQKTKKTVIFENKIMENEPNFYESYIAVSTAIERFTAIFRPNIQNETNPIKANSNPIEPNRTQFARRKTRK